MSINNANHKPFPPSSSRMASAASAGLFERSPILLFGITLLCVATAALSCKLFLFSAFFELFQTSLSHSDPVTVLRNTLHMLFFCSGILLLALVPGAIISVAMTKKRKRTGQSAIPLPNDIPTTLDTFIVASICVLLFIPVGISMAQGVGFTYEEIQFSPQEAANRFTSFFLWLLIAIGAISVIGGFVQLSLYKVRLFQHLSLTSSEQEKEQRLHGHSATKQSIHSLR